MGEDKNHQEDISLQIGKFQERLEELLGQEKGARLLETLEELSALVEELHVADQELRAQNEELASARDILEEERQRYQDLFEFAPDGYLVTNRAGKILEANQAASMLLNVPAMFLIGKPLAAYVYGEDRKDFRWRLEELVREKDDLHKRLDDWEVRLQPRKRGPVYTSITVQTVRSGDTLRWMIRDISNRKQIEVELEEVQRKLVENRDQERLQIARELHDGPVQDLLGLAFQLKALENTPDEGNNVENRAAVHSLLQHVISTLRTISGELRPPTLAPFGLEKAIQSHAQSVLEEHPELNIHLNLSPDGKTIPEPVRLALFRIYQQALSNVIRHARANQVWIYLELDPDRVLLQVRDDGVGFEVPKRWSQFARQGRLGLVGLAERVELLSGEFMVTSSPGEGTSVIVSVPIPHKHEG